MTWMATAIIGGSAIAGGAGGYLGANASNKNVKGALSQWDYKPYSGSKPPNVSYLRPVEQQITDILMRRSLGQDVGYDPVRRQELLDLYDISNRKTNEREIQDINNRLSGSGLSRNVAANEALRTRAMQDQADRRNVYTKGVDVEDLAKRNEERDVNTARLQNLNTFNFGQENTVSDFERQVWAQEQGLQAQRVGLGLQGAGMMEDPYSSALSSAANYGMGAYALSSPSMPTTAPNEDIGASMDKYGSNYNYNLKSTDPTTQAILKALSKGKSLGV